MYVKALESMKCPELSNIRLVIIFLADIVLLLNSKSLYHEHTTPASMPVALIRNIILHIPSNIPLPLIKRLALSFG